MLFFVFHPYTNNIAHVLLNVTGNNYWVWKFALSVAFLSVLCFVKERKSNWVVLNMYDFLF
ncbi:hypothetical protein D1115_14075 [Vibrio alfacsensis]|uniref:Uncharacterized protein n=1 Tax=Vibrio alfacsensis TaxID=1074311 RepID=A0ABN5PFY3_9VIBR|nr:hypothetical protein D1115_14075 [Vibrio alfacsensis]